MHVIIVHFLVTDLSKGLSCCEGTRRNVIVTSALIQTIFAVFLRNHKTITSKRICNKKSMK